MAFSITTLKLPPVLVDAAYNQTPATAGGVGPFVWSVLSGNFPSWAALNAGTGAITGTPRAAGMWTFELQVVDSTGAVATQDYTIVGGYTLISDIASWATSEYLNRGDLTTTAQNAALKIYRYITAKIPFDQLTAVTDELPLTAGIDTYDLSTLVPPLLGIISIRITITSTNRRRLRRSSPRLYDSLSVIKNGQPATYARTAALQIQINPPPDNSAYTMRIRYWSRPAEHPSVPASTILATPLEWNPLFEWETAYYLLNQLGQEQRAMALIQPMMMPRQSSPKRQSMQEIGIIPRLWNELLTTISQKENVDEDFGINPIIRPYSYR